MLRCSVSALAFEQAGTIDGNSRAIGGQLKQLGVGRAIRAPGHRPDVKHADDPVLEHERDAQHGLQPALAQDRIEDVGVVDITSRALPRA